MAGKIKKKGGSMRERGVSPIITSVLLIAIVIVIIAVIFLWFRGMVEEGVIKFGKNIKLVCEDVNFEASYTTGTLSIVNTGNVPLYRVNLKISQGGSYQIKDLKDMSAGSSWPQNGLGQGATFSADLGSELGSSEEITVLPVLIGTAGKGKKTFVCEGQYGKEIKL